MAANPPAPYRPRIALYGHDTQGLGHLRRNLHLAAGLAADLPGGLGADVLVVTGASEVGLFDRPHGVEAVVVPGVRKDAAGGYRPRRLRGHRLDDVVDLRSATISGALHGFNPDLLVVDKAPWGFAGELQGVLPELKAAGTRLVLGLRDVLDDPAIASREWRRDRGDDAVRTLYDEVWVYGDRAVHDVPAAAGMASQVRAKVHHVGYVCGRSAGLPTQPRAVDAHPAAVAAGGPPLPEGIDSYVLVMLGGGQDGLALARQAVRMTTPPGVGIVLLTGPQMHSGHVSELMATKRADHVVMSFSPHASEWLAGAAAAITMGGANTVTEILSTDTPALVVPRTRPRREQAVRAEALAARGLVETLQEPWLTARVLSEWVRKAVVRRVDRSAIDLRGVGGARDRAEMLLGRHDGQARLYPVRLDRPVAPMRARARLDQSSGLAGSAFIDRPPAASPGFGWRGLVSSVLAALPIRRPVQPVHPVHTGHVARLGHTGHTGHTGRLHQVDVAAHGRCDAALSY